MQEGSPLIVTLKLDEYSFSFFNALRKKHFPPAINYLSAHLTLFHHLPANEPAITNGLQTWTNELPALPLHVTEVKSIGKGVAYKIENAALLQLHKFMQQKWQPWLTPQDKQKLWPHVTVQNKVAVEEARRTLEILQASFQPFEATGLGFTLWAYESGPWRYIEDYLFKA